MTLFFYPSYIERMVEKSKKLNYDCHIELYVSGSLSIRCIIDIILNITSLTRSLNKK